MRDITMRGKESKKRTKSVTYCEERKVRDVDDIPLSDWISKTESDIQDIEMRGKESKKTTKSVTNGEERKVQDVYDIPLSDWISETESEMLDSTMRGKESRKKTKSVTNSEERKVRDVDDILLSEWISNKKRCTQDNRPSPNGASLQEQASVQNKENDISAKPSSGTVDQVSDASGELVRNPLDIEDDEIIRDMKNRYGYGSVYDPVVVEKPKEKFTMDEIQESAAAKARRLKLDEEIEQLKEEIALIQAKLTKLESAAEVDNAANK